MSLSIFSFITALIWSNIFIIILSILKNQNKFISLFSFKPLIFLIIICILRLIFMFETNHMVIIRSYDIFPNIIDLFNKTIFTIYDYKFSILNIFIFIWVSGTIICIFTYIKELIKLKSILKNSKPIKNPNIIKILNNVISNSNKVYKTSIFELDFIPSPMVYGFFTPKIYLPKIHFSDEELYYILSHEYYHFLNRDIWIKLFMHIICSIFWFNPFIHILKINLIHMLEIRCDNKVITDKTENEKIKYLESIMKVLKYQLSNKYLLNNTFKRLNNIVFFKNKNTSNIEQRFNIVTKNYRNKKFDILLYISIFILFIISNIYIVQPAYECIEPNAYSINSENSYILNNNGIYEMYIDNKFVANIKESELKKEPLSYLKIKNIK